MELKFLQWLKENLWFVFWIAPLLVYFFFRRKTKRDTESLKEVGVRMGLSMSPEKYPLSYEELKKLSFFSGQTDESFHNILKGSKRFFNVAIFNYSPDVEEAPVTVFLFKSTQLNLPHFKLSPLNTTAGVKFHQFPKFSLQYHLACSEEEQIRSVFNTKVLSFYENRNHKFFSVEGLGTLLLFYKPYAKIAPGKIREYYEEAHTIAQAFL